MEQHASTTMRTLVDARGISREDVRARLLTGFPATERRLSLNNLSTAVLEGGDGPRSCCCTVRVVRGPMAARDPGSRDHTPGHGS